ncbi:uncharacterized protein TM35_000074130 [Trypanosoma theileri]|uniref:Uncharacterized protein n=1 Tax=Trypanosoma theileri TaxID=67003 RepID=A0A1X0P359_9TRYP|nr:uncharacterized protein TM35_000074130 [Trypanosoma theileri]ORC90989.1 hypothetical protein TM35_000074130 [Trypanosoma theileri]
MLTIQRLPSPLITTGLLLLLLPLCLTFTCSAAPAHAPTLLSVAGSVVVPLNATPFIDVQVVDGSSGAVLRFLPLDASRTFAFAGLPPAATEVRLFLRLPERRFRFSPEASTLAVAIPKNTVGGVAPWLQLTAAVEELQSTPAGEQQQGSLLALLVTVVGMVLAIAGRHKLVSLLHLPVVKLPKQRRMVVPMSR